MTAATPPNKRLQLTTLRGRLNRTVRPQVERQYMRRIPVGIALLTIAIAFAFTLAGARTTRASAPAQAVRKKKRTEDKSIRMGYSIKVPRSLVAFEAATSFSTPIAPNTGVQRTGQSIRALRRITPPLTRNVSPLTSILSSPSRRVCRKLERDR